MDKLFKLKENNTNVKTEVLAGITTFLTMCYIIFVNPAILSTTGMDTGAVMIATCIAAAVGSILMGLLANYPFALAPGMGLNAFFAYTICGSMGYSWQAALAAVFISGVFFVIITVTGLRTVIVKAIPTPLRRAISAGIGLFIAVIGLEQAGIIAAPAGGATIIGLGDFGNPVTLLAIFGFVLTIALLYFNVKGGLFIGIVAVSAAGAALQFAFGVDIGIVKPEFDTGFADSFKAFGQLFGKCFTGLGELFYTGDGIGVMLSGFLSMVVSLTLSDMFDTIGMFIGITENSGFLDKDGNMPRMERALLSDAVATTAGALLGTSTVTSYMESAVGIKEGGRTGLTAVVTGVLFLISLLLSPLLGLVPGAATAPVLIIAGIMMCTNLKDIEWGDLRVAVPCFMASFMMPLAYSVADGIGFGFIFYVLVKLLTMELKKLHPVLVVLALVFTLRYILMAVGMI